MAAKEKEISNWPEEFKPKMRMKFIELCKIILYSSDMRKINYAYNSIFTEFRTYILSSDNVIKNSIFEDVIIKLLNDEEDGLYERYGIYNSPFTRYVALIKEYELKAATARTRKIYGIHRRCTAGYPPYDIKYGKGGFNPKSYLFAFIAGHKEDIKNKKILSLIKQSFSEF